MSMCWDGWVVGNTALPKELMLKLGKESKVSLKTLARFVSKPQLDQIYIGVCRDQGDRGDKERGKAKFQLPVDEWMLVFNP